jgi:hypothetical protein
MGHGEVRGTYFGCEDSLSFVSDLRPNLFWINIKTQKKEMKHQINVRVYTKSKKSTRRVIRKICLFSNKNVSVGSILSILRLNAFDLLRLKMEKASTRQHVDLDPEGIIQELDVPVRDSQYELNLYV